MSRNPEIEEMKQTILLMEEEIKRLSSPPYTAATVLQIGKKTAQLVTDGGKFAEVELPKEKGLSEELRKKLKPSSKVVLNPEGAIVDYSEFGKSLGGEISTVDEVCNGRLRVHVNGNPRLVFNTTEGVKPGDEIQLDRFGLMATERFDRKKTRYALEKIPQAPWSNIGGLESTITQIRAEVEEPFLHKEVFARYGRKPAKGILLYGPPGCGKTMIAKSIAYNLAKMAGNGAGHFISVKGPEILDKFVGNSEANIRRVYAAARDEAEQSKVPTIVFIDEAESVMKTRGSGISTDVYDSIVPQFLAEMDGMNGDCDVVTVLATNREDILDPAILRNGRVDLKIRVPRPNREGAKKIFEIYLKNKPLQGFTSSLEKFAEQAVSRIYDEQTTYNVVSPKGILGKFGPQSMMSGAIIKGIVDRACGYAIQREINRGKKGLSVDDLYQATESAFSESSGFSQSLVRDDWQALFGEKGRQLFEAYQRGDFYLERADNTSYSQLTERRNA